MSFTYPAAPATVGTDLTTIEIHHLLKSPTVVRKRLETLLGQRFISDFLLAGRYQAVGGSILYETGEEIFPADNVEDIAPGGEYPRTVLTSGELAAAKTTKWGLDSPVTDESIARLGIDPVNRALTKLANGVIRDVDSSTLTVIASKVTQTVTVTTSTGDVPTGAWTTDKLAIEGILRVKAFLEEANVGAGFDYNTVALKPSQFAKIASYFISGGLLPRENGNAVQTGVLEDILGLTWVTSTHLSGSDPLLVDRDQLGGMADEDLGGGYAGMSGVEVKSIRQDLTDSYLLRARRVTVPVVLEPKAAAVISGTGL